MKYKVVTYYKKHDHVNGYTFKAKNNLTALAHIAKKLKTDIYGVKKSKIRLVAL